MSSQILYSNEDTIAAVSTAYGEGGIGIVRISGPDSLSVLKKLFQAGKYSETNSDAAAQERISVIDDANVAAMDAAVVKTEAGTTTEFENRHMYYGHIIDPDTGEIVDEVPSNGVVRLENCVLRNRTDERWPENGLYYVLEGRARLELPNIEEVLDFRRGDFVATPVPGGCAVLLGAEARRQ